MKHPTSRTPNRALAEQIMVVSVTAEVNDINDELTYRRVGAALRELAIRADDLADIYRTAP